jgi:hypothetical protein
MDPTVIRDDIGHREHPGVPGLGEHVDAHPGQRAVRSDQLLVHPVYPTDQTAHPGQVQLRPGRAGQHPGPRAGLDQRAHRRRVQFHVGVQINAGEGAAGRVAQPQRVGLSGYRRLDDPHAGLPRRGGRTVSAGVGHHDDVELAGRRAGQQPAQIAGDDGGLVVCRHHDAHHRADVAGLVTAGLVTAGLVAHANRLPSAARQDSRHPRDAARSGSSTFGYRIGACRP